jgi:ABC-2 type transport system permease protein
MRNVLSVMKYELYTTLSKPSFWLTTFLVPLLIIGINVGSQLLVRNATSGASQAGNPAAPGNVSSIAYVDEAGLIQRVPPEVPEGALRAFPSQEAAKAALEAGEISQYYVIPADFMETGKLVLIVNKFAALSSSQDQQMVRYLLGANLVDDPARAAAVVEPLWSVETQALAPQEPSRQDNPLNTVVPLATIMIFFFVLTFTGSFMLQSVTREKENRTAEVLLVSLRPHELMLGKIVGLAVIGLAQMVIWVGGGVLVLGQARQVIATAESFALPAGFFIWGLLYFLLGYLLYASAMAGLGALAPTAREANQATFVMIVPLMLPLLANVAFSEAPNGALATFLSLFPLTSPVSMVTRLAVGEVPFWQPVVGLLLLAASGYVVVLLAGRLFRADTLLSSSALSWSRVTRELRKSG